MTDPWAVVVEAGEFSERSEMAAPRDDVPSLDADPNAGASAVPNLDATASSQAGPQPTQLPSTPMARLVREQPATPTQKKRRGRTGKKKRASRTAFASVAKRRTLQKHYGSRLAMVQPPMGTRVPCVFTDRHAIPLWPQYGLVEAPSQQGGSKSTWIQVQTRQAWFDDYVSKLLDKVTKYEISPRQVVKRKQTKLLSDSLEVILRDALFTARRKHAATNSIETTSSDEPEENCSEGPADGAPTWDMRMVTREIPSLVVDIGEYRLTMLNSLRPKCLQIDANTQEFISSYFPKALAEVHFWQFRGLPAPKQLPTQTTFSIQNQDTPDIRDKVTWMPLEHTWRIHVKNEKVVADACHGQRRHFCSVDQLLLDAEYYKAKRNAYERAKHLWNQMDGTKRDRIGMTVPLPIPTVQTYF
jgi:hypothetical protein